MRIDVLGFAFASQDIRRPLSPHPNPLPKGEGTAFVALEKFYCTQRYLQFFSWAGVIQPDSTGMLPRQDTILPLRVGEGRGEGDRDGKPDPAFGML